jgi:ankyrin repeat protein
MVDIKKLINKNRWDIIEKKLDNLDLSSFIHLATMNNNNKIINYALKHNPRSLEINNDDGETSVHLMAKYGLSDMLKKVVKEQPTFANLQNKKHQTPMSYLAKYGYVDTLLQIIDKSKNIDSLTINDSGNTLFDILTKRSKNKTDQYYEAAKKLLKTAKQDPRINGTKSPLIKAVKDGKFHMVDLMLKNNLNPNIHDDAFITPSQIAIFSGNNDIADILYKYGASFNNNGPEGDQDPMLLAIMNDDEELVNKLLERGYDPNQHNRYLETSTHGVLSKNNFKPTTIAKFLYYGDLNFQNVDGLTPLHLFLQTHDWKLYEEILKKKKLDIFAMDKDHKTPPDYLKPQQLTPFLNLVAEGYIGQIQQGNKQKRDDMIANKNSCRIDELNYQRCITNIKDQMMKTKRSYPEAEDEIQLEGKFRLIEERFTQNGRFNADTIHNIIYTVEMLKRHPELGIPCQYYFPDKAMTELNKQKQLDLYREPSHKIISNLVRIYHDYSFELTPYLIVWAGPTAFHIHSNLDFYLLKLLINPGIKFIFMKITFIVTSHGTHAGILIIDKVNKIIDRFEPYGVVPYLENNKLDVLLKDRIVPIVKKITGDSYEYLSPSDYMKGGAFQVISNDTDIQVRNLGDPNGYCLAWTYWYLEMRIANPEIHPKKLVKKSIKKIIESYQNISGDMRFIYFIRNYSQRLDRMKNLFLKTVDVPEQYMYNMVLPDADQDKVVKGLAHHLEKFVISRFESK